jgi:glycosyltransferase involved in cell wall biosynthesis
MVFSSRQWDGVRKTSASLTRMQFVADIQITAIVTAFDEGTELLNTVRSVTDAMCYVGYEILVVDDGSTDGYPQDPALALLVKIVHPARTGVANSRDEAVEIASGTCFAFLDGHQRLTTGCLNECAQLAIQENAIVCPDITGYNQDDELLHGAYFHMPRRKPPFGANWRTLTPKKRVTRISSLKAPAYVIPAAVYPKVRWSRLLKGWGGSEGSVSVKAFFTDTRILHLHGPIAYHKFKKSFHYDVTWDEIWRNHALIARICFSEATWYDYWLPEVFQEHLSEETQQEMDSDPVKAEHLEFQQIKVRPDHEFWTRLAFQKIPSAVKR